MRKMKTAKEKAVELFDKFYAETILGVDGAKKCALICVDEILKYLESDGFPLEVDYWQEVRLEIEKL